MSSTIPVDEWDKRKEEILRLYIDEGWALKPVMRAMRSSDFDPTCVSFHSTGETTKTDIKSYQRVTVPDPTEEMETKKTEKRATICRDSIQSACSTTG